MELVALEKGQEVYHGSIRLRDTQLYLSSNMDILLSYLSSSSFSTNVNILTSNDWSVLRKVYTLYSCPYDDAVAYGKEAAYMQVAVYLQSSLSTLAVLKVLVREKEETPSSSLLLSFAEEVEDGLVDIEEAFTVSFYSVMRLPVQFFTWDKEYASQYGPVYKYTLKETVRLVEVGKAASAKVLGDEVFAGREVFSSSTLRYFDCRVKGEDSLVAMRKNILFIFSTTYSPLPLLISLFLSICGRGKIYPPVEEKLSTNWNDYFGIDLLTPFVLWRLSCWNYNGDGRYTSYPTDALLLNIMIEDGRYSGWYDSVQDEMVVIDPSYYGEMVVDE